MCHSDEPRRKSLLREYHALARTDVQHDDGRRWTLFGAFLIAETLLSSLLDRNHDALLGALGISSTILIGLAMWRNNVYLRDRSILAAELETKIGFEHRFYDKRARIPEERLARQNGYGIFPTLQGNIARAMVPVVTAWALMRTTLFLAVIAWIGVILHALHVELYTTLWVCAALLTVVLLDWGAEIEQRAKSLRPGK